MTLLAYGFSGLVLALSLGSATPEQAVFVASSFGVVLAAFGVVGSYDELMGRPKENAWLATLPATERQHYAARLLGIAAYVGLMAISVAVPVAVRLGLGFGVSSGVQVGVLVGIGVMWTAALSLALMWAISLALPPRIARPALTAARTILIATLVLGYQWIGAEPEAASAPWWPAAWLSDAMAGRSTLGLAMLVGATGALIVAFATAFPRRYFTLLDRIADGTRWAEDSGKGQNTLTWPERVAVRGAPARAAYGFALAAITRDRIVRGRLWPAALLPLGFAVFGWLGGGLESLFIHGAENALALEETQLHLSLLVILLFCAQTLVQAVQVSDHDQASWVFDTLPDARPRRLQLGAQQALTFRVLLPLHALLAATLALQMPALDACVHALFWFSVTAVTTRVYSLFQRSTPFSRRSDRFSIAARFIPLLASVPTGLAALLIQTFAFTSPVRAIFVSLVILAVNALLARVVTGPPHHSAPEVPRMVVRPSRPVAVAG
ncbi:hypothetical protein BSZ36_08185 [Rubricoccus marinus]|uniref:Uncharacterized protein n=2 Tax=Rubricoccus marinus TaxID=716817 RepID=A0A259TZ33_9BACT|nr:hypothetical protein BSZ36_08185 [Rubricoccus marinus]